MNESESTFIREFEVEIEAEKVKNDIHLILRGLYFGVLFIMFFVPLDIILGVLL